MGELLERAYRRLGVRYPAAVIRAVLGSDVVNVPLGVGMIVLFADGSAVEFVRLGVVGLILLLAYNAIWERRAVTHLEPVRNWLAGDRSETAGLEAWRACASFPYAMMRLVWLTGMAWLSLVLSLAWTAYTVWELELDPFTGVPLLIGLVAFVVYLNVLRFFAYERGLRPVLADIASQTDDDVGLYAPGFPLRVRLLAALPAINVLTGLAAVGITGQGHHLELSDLGLAVVVSTAIAATLSGALVVLIADSVTAPIGSLHSATERVASGDFGTRVPVVTTDETGALARSFNEMAAGLEQRERLREAFGAFVDPDLTERVLEQGTDFAGEDVELSLLFMDIRGFTSYSESAEARDVVATLNDLYGAVVPVILSHGGHANKFIGDGLLAIFGAPDRLPDHADRAVAAALEVAELVASRYGGELRVGIGVNTGRVVVGTIGGGGRLDFTVIGDAVNTAARVESATRETGDDVLITDATRAALSDGVAGWEERPPVALKGKTREVRLFAPRLG